MMFSKVVAALSPLRNGRSLAPAQANGQGLVVFDSVTDALHAGYMVHDSIEGGYVVRIMTAGGWAKAIVRCKQ